MGLEAILRLQNKSEGTKVFFKTLHVSMDISYYQPLSLVADYV